MDKLFRYTVTKEKSSRVYRITWENYPMDDRVYAKTVRWVKQSTDYGPLTTSRLHSMKQFLTALNRKYGTDTAIEQLISTRFIVLKDKIIKNYARMNKNIEKITREYDRGADILDLAATYDFPPLNLLRGIFISKDMPSGKVYNVFANKTNPRGLLSGRDLKQFRLAERNDAESTHNQRETAARAERNELAVTDFFTSLGIKLKSQDDLVREQTEKYGRPLITPDILFLDEVYINDVRVHWIDYKDYTGTAIHFLYTSNANQAGRYNEKWGPGALCYRYAYVSGLIIPGAILLDARSLPIKLE